MPQLAIINFYIIINGLIVLFYGVFNRGTSWSKKIKQRSYFGHTFAIRPMTLRKI
ncbi:hypothetical protein YERSI8AC_240103 [Enterobacterales bacterium 8AC]|nr:hypothetical protein YERSI8AC_240103 [Enterobacterales bacterium 8AC]